MQFSDLVCYITVHVAFASQLFFKIESLLLYKHIVYESYTVNSKEAYVYIWGMAIYAWGSM